MKKKNIFHNQRGIALVMALLISVAIMAMIFGTLLIIDRSTQISGAGKAYSTAEEAADGAVNILKDAVNLAMWGEPMADTLFLDAGECDDSVSTVDNLDDAVLLDGSVCVTRIELPGTMTNYTATVTLERLYSVIPPGARLEFARSSGGASSAMIFFRITTKVVGPNNTTAENSVLYRFAG
jgi:Tfp pilus assembly protein PilX